MKHYLVAYDSSNTSTQSQLRKYIQDYSRIGQKSAYECHLDPKQYQLLLSQLTNKLVDDDDKLSLFGIIHCLWQTHPTTQRLQTPNEHCLYIG